jgi:2-phosphoglycerate kinase
VYCDYIELMEYRRNPNYGKTKCFQCLLSPSREESAIFLGINKVIAKAIEQENNIICSTIYPCPILNRYECPFKKKVMITTIR